MAGRGGRRRAAAMAAVVGLCLTAASCSDSGSTAGDAGGLAEADPLATEPLPREQTARCGEAALGGSGEGWRRYSIDSGPFGFFGSGGGFARPGNPLVTREGVKLPAVVAGKRRVIVSIAPGDRDRVRLQYGFTGRRTAAPVSRIAFEPCVRRDATSWPGGLRMRDASEPVEVRVAVEGETEVRRLTVGEGRIHFDASSSRDRAR